MEGKVIFKGNSKNDKEIIIRYPVKEDAKIMWEYINILSQERTFISFQGEEISLEEEEKYLDSILEKISKKEAVKLVVFCDGKIIGVSDIEMKSRIERHIGVLGISIAKEFRGEGIGSDLMQFVLDEAEKNIPQLEIVTLGVFSNNDLAKKMYQKFGFLEYGNLLNGVKLEEGYSNHVFMYKVLKPSQQLANGGNI